MENAEVKDTAVRKTIHFIINPVSGTGRHDDLVTAIGKYMDHSQYDCTIRMSDSPRHAILLARQAVDAKADAIVTAGGDGSINEIAQAIKGTDIALGIIPAGSGNGLAHHLRIPFRIGKAIDVINAFNTKRIDTLEINGVTCVSIAGVGFDAIIARKFATNEQRGFQSYFRIVLNEYPSYKPQKYTLRIDGIKYREKALLISFANSNQFGYNAYIAPMAELDDGLMDVCLVRKIPMAKVAFLANLLFMKQIDKSRYIRIIKGKHVLLKGNSMRIVNIDGETETMGEELEIKVNPLSLSVIVP
ncbi:MAG: YegS/Rv2252/BmrU family lipid kinase [Bacteroidales bacterium]|nr:YegS/Rv2252/BmrU family lipid kinase [Lentimicrobiaceae bacterium]MDD5694143.1 YegS/Rv2252/BmrU family lipid kinase [Bacteroidales bacterium]